MAERSFASEVEHLRLGAGETFTGEGILALTKALLENGVGYVGGYQGAPISHLMDVLADAEGLMAEHYDPRYAKHRARYREREAGTVPVKRLDAAGIEGAAAAIEARISVG